MNGKMVWSAEEMRDEGKLIKTKLMLEMHDAL